VYEKEKIMYKITQIDNRKNGNWFKPVTDWSGLKANGYSGAYILAHQVIQNNSGQYVFQDNLFLDDIFAEAQDNGFRVGFFVVPDGVKISYAKVFQDLAFKRNAFGSSLLPAVVIGAWPSGYTVHQVEEDFIGYFNDILVKPLGDVVLGLNKATADLLTNSKSSVILNTLAQPGVRIWYYRFGLTPDQMNAELLATPAKKSVWIAGVSLTENQADWKSVTPPVVPPVVPPTTDIKAQLKVVIAQLSALVEKL
jgi:hypothetical protein